VSQGNDQNENLLISSYFHLIHTMQEISISNKKKKVLNYNSNNDNDNCRTDKFKTMTENTMAH
jgi:hypothetical protein